MTVGVARAQLGAPSRYGSPARVPLLLLGIVTISCLLLLVATLNPLVACVPMVLAGAALWWWAGHRLQPRIQNK